MPVEDLLPYLHDHRLSIFSFSPLPRGQLFPSPYLRYERKFTFKKKKKVFTMLVLESLVCLSFSGFLKQLLTFVFKYYFYVLRPVSEGPLPRPQWPLHAENHWCRHSKISSAKPSRISVFSFGGGVRSVLTFAPNSTVTVRIVTVTE